MATVRVEWASAKLPYSVTRKVLSAEVVTATGATAQASGAAPDKTEIAIIRATSGSAYVSVGESVDPTATTAALILSGDPPFIMHATAGDQLRVLEV